MAPAHMLVYVVGFCAEAPRKPAHPTEMARALGASDVVAPAVLFNAVIAVWVSAEAQVDPRLP